MLSLFNPRNSFSKKECMSSQPGELLFILFTPHITSATRWRPCWRPAFLADVERILPLCFACRILEDKLSELTVKLNKGKHCKHETEEIQLPDYVKSTRFSSEIGIYKNEHKNTAIGDEGCIYC